MTITDRVGLRYVLSGLLLCSLYTTAFGQTEPIIIQVSDLNPINADDCESRLSQQLSFQIQHTDSSPEQAR